MDGYMSKINPDDIVGVYMFSAFNEAIRFIVEEEGLYIAYDNTGRQCNSHKSLSYYEGRFYKKTNKIKRTELSHFMIDEKDIVFKTKDFMWVK
jgi:hypothetical protein